MALCWLKHMSQKAVATDTMELPDNEQRPNHGKINLGFTDFKGHFAQ